MLDPILQAQAVTGLRETLEAMGEADDAALFLDMIEGETSFFDAIDRLVAARAVDLAMVDGIKKLAGELSERRQRYEKRAETAKALLEQAFLVAGLDKVERPGATLFLSNRAPKVIVETESDIPARYWKVPDPVLDGKALADDLKSRRALLDAVLKADGEDREAAIAAFHQAFLDDAQVADLRERLTLLDAMACDDEARGPAVSAIRHLFADVPGATLSAAGRSLSIRVA
jgi:hypothetical protein